jgi:hypothetical protein
VVLRLREGWKAAGEGAKGKPRMSHAWSNSKNWDKRGLWAFGVVFCAPGMANTALPRLWGRKDFLFLSAFLMNALQMFPIRDKISTYISN